MNSILKRLVIISIACTASFQTAFAQVKAKTPLTNTAVKNAVITKTALPLPNEPWKALLTKERLIEINTDFGVMIAKLYDSTPLHRDNFIKLVEQNFYDSLLFHRVINQFMIQGGDPESRTAHGGARLGSGSVIGDRIPAELKPYLFHKKGALAAARDDNPAKASSNCLLYSAGKNNGRTGVAKRL